MHYLDFEASIAELEGRIIELRRTAEDHSDIRIEDEIQRLEKRVQSAIADTYKNLTPWQKTQVARHPDRPHCLEYVDKLITEFTPMAGDRYFGDDKAIITGFGRFRGESIAIIGQEKGNDTKSRIEHNFGMAMPEGYRKAVRIMQLASRFGIPILSLVDTAGAYPGVAAEQRGQAEAIARSIEACLAMTVPSVTVIIG